jgi:hypothetical protein
LCLNSSHGDALNAMNHERACLENSSPILLGSSTVENNEKTIEKFTEEQYEHIEDLTEIINSIPFGDLAALGVFNERGIAYLFIGEFESALQDFNHVLTELQIRQILERELIGTALWGRLFCHAYRNQLQETCDDFQLIQLFSIKCTSDERQAGMQPCVPASNVKNDYFILPVAKFAYPEEKVSVYECRERVRNTADKMRSIADLIPIRATRILVLGFISDEEGDGLGCCNRGQHWTNCTGPIADGWKRLEDTWDQVEDLYNKGINLSKFLFRK